jgi:hypothetical protein
VTAWVSPLPAGMKAFVTVIRPEIHLAQAASAICERAWKGPGVRVFAWPCGTLAVVAVGSRGDVLLLHHCVDRLLATYARQGVFGTGPLGPGPMYVDVMGQLRAARAAA